MENVRGIAVVGGSFPARIWHDFMIEALAAVPPHDFPQPDFGGDLLGSPSPSPSSTPSASPPASASPSATPTSTASPSPKPSKSPKPSPSPSASGAFRGG